MFRRYTCSVVDIVYQKVQPVQHCQFGSAFANPITLRWPHRTPRTLSSLHPGTTWRFSSQTRNPSGPQKGVLLDMADIRERVGDHRAGCAWMDGCLTGHQQCPPAETGLTSASSLVQRNTSVRTPSRIRTFSFADLPR